MSVALQYPQAASRGFRGGVAAGGALATTAASDVLERGGSAVDAVVAGAFVQSVVEVQAGGLGGDAFILVHTAEGETVTLNGSGAAPVRLDGALADGALVPRFGPLSVAVPGFVAAVCAAHDRYGRLPFAELVDPAISYAFDGFAVSAELHEAAERVLPSLGHDAPLRTLLRANVTSVGAPFTNRALGRTLEAIRSDGPSSFYDDLGPRLSAALRNRGGVLDAADLAAHEPTWVEPVRTVYRGLDIVTNPPVSLGALLLAELGLYERLDLGPLDPLDPRRIDAMVRCKRAVFADGFTLLRDPELGADGAAELLDPGRLDHWADRLLADPLERLDAGLELTGDGVDTTCIVAADGQGNVAALIHSLFNEFGSHELDEESGVLLNDRLANQRLAVADGPGVRPGGRPMHTLCAAVVLDHGRPALLACTPGGRGQVQTLFQVIVNRVDNADDPQVAVDHPRWLSGSPRRPRAQRPALHGARCTGGGRRRSDRPGPSGHRDRWRGGRPVRQRPGHRPGARRRSVRRRRSPPQRVRGRSVSRCRVATEHRTETRSTGSPVDHRHTPLRGRLPPNPLTGGVARR